MNYGICMRQQCKNCKRSNKCFKEGDFDYEYTKSKNRNTKDSKLQSKKGFKIKRTRITKNKKKYSRIWIYITNNNK